MANNEWVEEFPVAVSVCDTRGVFLEMNNRAEEIFASHGGRSLLGASILNCHHDRDLDRLKSMLLGQIINCYISEKAGVRRLIYQAPWRTGGIFRGLVELIIELPPELPEKKV